MEATVLPAGAGEPMLGWRLEPAWLHLAAVSLLVLAALMRFWPSVTTPSPLPDEMGYVRGITRVLDGGSPYPGGSYLYPPLVAYAGAWGWEHLGPGAVLATFRAANLLGAASAVWCAVVWLPWAWRWRLGVGVFYLALAPIVRSGMLLGNLSMAVAGLIVLGLLAWPRRPVAAGMLLGLSLAIKPLAPATVLVLAAHRPSSGGRRHWVAVGVSALLAAALVVTFPRWWEMLAVLRQPHLMSRSLSLHRLFYLMGLEGGMTVIMVAVALGLAILARLRPLGRLPLYGFGVAAALAASPSVWSHALLMALPLQVLALVVAWRRLQGAEGEGERRRRRWELIFVVLATAAIQFAEGATSFDDQPAWFELPGVLPPVLAPGALALYLVARAPSAAAGRRRSRCPSPAGTRG